MAAATADDEVTVQEPESCENGKNETDKVVDVAEEIVTKDEEVEAIPPEAAEEKPEEKPVEELAALMMGPPPPLVFVPKYKYTDGEFPTDLVFTNFKTYAFTLVIQKFQECYYRCQNIFLLV